jgi:hypothetical protein
VQLTASTRTQAVGLEELGLGLDAGPVADRLTGFTLNPVSLWRRTVGGGSEEDADPGPADARVNQGLEGLRKVSGQAPKNAAVVLKGSTVQVEKSSEGYQIADDAARVVRAHWLTGRVDLPESAQPPLIDTADAEKAVAEQAEPALSGPLTVRIGEAEVELTPGQFAPALSFVEKGGELVLSVDGRN